MEEDKRQRVHQIPSRLRASCSRLDVGKDMKTSASRVQMAEKRGKRAALFLKLVGALRSRRDLKRIIILSRLRYCRLYGGEGKMLVG